MVRDPRALVASRLAVFERQFAAENQATPSWVMEDFKHVCDRYIENWNYLASEEGKWLKEKLILIRYEDFALNPEAYVRKIYKILNIKPQDIKSILQVEESIYKMTHTQKDDDILGGDENLVEFDEYRGVLDRPNRAKKTWSKNDIAYPKTTLYSTEKNADKVAFAWKDRLSFPVAKLVQDESCGRGLMHALGYQIYLDETEYFASVSPLDANWPYKLI